MTVDPNPVAMDIADEADDSNRKRLLALGGGLAALVVLGAGYLFLSGGGDSVDEAFVPVARTPRVAAAPSAAAKARTLAPKYTEQIGRDPFKALYVVPVVAPVDVAAPAAAPVVLQPATTTSGGTTSVPVAAPTTKRYTLTLNAISKPSPEVRTTTWTVDGNKVTVLPAQRFGKYGELVVLAYTQDAKGVVNGAVLQVGDDTPVDVKIGESNSVL
ncbi:MAG: hypothetical protein ABIO67_11460 [Mycobacteriales bacterium]